MSARSGGLIALFWVVVMALALPMAGAIAHPMPDTEIDVARTANEVEMVVRVPTEDLMLTLPDGFEPAAEALTGRYRRWLIRYFQDHMRLKADGHDVPFTVTDVAIDRSKHADVGDYSEVVLIARASVAGDVPATLSYDAVLHKVANHQAIVRAAAPIGAAPRADAPASIGMILGTIRYSLADKTANTVDLPVVADLESEGADSVAAEDMDVTKEAMWAVPVGIALVVILLGAVLWIRGRKR